MTSHSQPARRVVAVIPARGGSKGVPGKNIRPLAGKPLIAHTIEAARSASRVDEVYVSTDDHRIKAAAEAAGARIIDRPADIAGDTASSESALLHALDVLACSDAGLPDVLVFLQCTSPLTTASDIDGTIEGMDRLDADTAFAAVPFHYFVWQRSENGRDMLGVNHEKSIRLRRQDRDAQYLETGSVYVMKVPGFLNAKHRFFGRTSMYEMDAARCLEIDEESDFDRAERLMGGRQV